MMSIVTRGGSVAALVTLFVGGLVPCRAATCLSVVSNGYTFVNVNGPNAGTNAAAGTNLNGLSTRGVAVGFDIDNNGNFHNFFGDIVPNLTQLNINGSTTAMALGINGSNAVVGTDGNGNAFYLQGATLQTFIPGGGSAAVALGINDKGNIVGQYTTPDGKSPGFFLTNHESTSPIRINAPSGPDTVNAQGVNLEGQIVGFYVGTNGQDHGFTANLSQAQHGLLTGTPVADPTIPSVAGEPGATFVFSQILAVNDSGIAVGYYGDSTTSQHGYLYNLNTGHYAFLDDPAEAFSNGVEVTQITGINDAGELTGFYSDANGVFHGFFAWPAGPACSK